MKTLILLTVISAGSLPLGRADTTNAPAPIRLSASEANAHFDESAVVTGKVVQVTFRPKVVFLNLDKLHPDTPFTAVIFAKDTNSFGDLKLLEGKNVEISGKIKEFKSSAEIVVESTNQLKVLPAPAPAKP